MKVSENNITYRDLFEIYKNIYMEVLKSKKMVMKKVENGEMDWIKEQTKLFIANYKKMKQIYDQKGFPLYSQFVAK